MGEIVQQLTELFWGALPTAIIVFLFILFLRWSFWTPFQKVLEQREAATEGARKQASDLLAQAEEKIRQYEDALRQARAEIYREQEESRRQALEERAQTLTKAREQANQQIQQAKAEIATEVAGAKKDLEAQTRQLAEEITGTLLAPSHGSRGNA